MDEPYCVESCPVQALVMADSEEMAKKRLEPLKKERWVRLNFVSD